MPTPVESAQLLLKIFELRREPTLREARQWWLRELTPETFEELVESVRGERNAAYRMVAGYWDMASSFVTYGAIDADMFRAANAEIFATVSKIYPFLARLREASGIPEFFRHAESVVTGMEGGMARLELLRGQFLASKKAKAARA
jgi:hypothetical protein